MGWIDVAAARSSPAIVLAAFARWSSITLSVASTWLATCDVPALASGANEATKVSVGLWLAAVSPGREATRAGWRAVRTLSNCVPELLAKVVSDTAHNRSEFADSPAVGGG